MVRDSMKAVVYDMTTTRAISKIVRANPAVKIIILTRSADVMHDKVFIWSQRGTLAQSLTVQRF